MKRNFRTLLLALAFAATVENATSQTRNSAAAVVTSRQAGFKDIGRSAKILTVGARQSAPNMAQIAVETARVAALANQSAKWFPRGSGPSSGITTSAGANIWTEPAKFNSALQQFRSAARAADQAARTGNAAAFASQWRKVGATCKACHDVFRTD